MDDFLYRARPWAITLLLHNWPVMLAGALAVPVAVRAYLRPTRRILLVLYGLLGLAFAFEYQKHLAPALRDTARYLFSAEVNPGPRAVSQFVVADLAPAALYIFAVVLLLAAAAPWWWRRSAGRAPSVAVDLTRAEAAVPCPANGAPVAGAGEQT
jgi:hypothetical protein